MGLKFRKRITIFPGFKLNISKSGISSTLGVKGLNVNFNKTGNYLNLGLPGSGIYDRIKISGKPNLNDTNQIDIENVVILENEIKSLDIGKMSDEIGEQIKKDIKESYKQKKELKKDIIIIKIKIFLLGVIYYLGGFIFNKYKKYFLDSKKLLDELSNIYDNSYINLDFNFDSKSETLYSELEESFNNLIKSKKVWDITSAKDNNGISDRSGASTLLTREVSSIDFGKLDFINLDKKVLKFVNKNGGDIFITPSYIIIKKGDNLDIFDIRKLEINYYRNNFIEEEKVPKDAVIIDYTWKYVNKTGAPDKRYSNNFKIPIVEYGNIIFESDTGMFEEFSFSSSDLLIDFGEKLNNYINYLK